MAAASRFPVPTTPVDEPLRELLIDGLVAALVADLERRPGPQHDEPAGAGR
jgi:hypothetical protein